MSDSSRALVGIKHDQPVERAHMLQGIKRTGVEANFIWVTAHIGVESNDLAERWQDCNKKRTNINGCNIE